MGKDTLLSGLDTFLAGQSTIMAAQDAILSSQSTILPGQDAILTLQDVHFMRIFGYMEDQTNQEPPKFGPILKVASKYNIARERRERNERSS